MAKSLLDIITGREDRPIRPEVELAKTRRAPFKPKRLTDSAIYEGPEGELPEIVVTAKREPPPKAKGSAFWGIVRDVVAGALKAYAMGPGRYLELEEAKTEAEKDRAHERELYMSKLKAADKRSDFVESLRLIRQHRSDLVRIYSSPLFKGDQHAKDQMSKMAAVLEQEQPKRVFPRGAPTGKGFTGMTVQEIEAEIAEREGR